MLGIDQYIFQWTVITVNGEYGIGSAILSRHLWAPIDTMAVAIALTYTTNELIEKLPFISI